MFHGSSRSSIWFHEMFLFSKKKKRFQGFIFEKETFGWFPGLKKFQLVSKGQMGLQGASRFCNESLGIQVFHVDVWALVHAYTDDWFKLACYELPHSVGDMFCPEC